MDPAEREVAGALGPEQRAGVDAEAVEVAGAGRDLRLRDAADQVGGHVLRFRVRRVVHVAADVQVAVVDADDLGLVHQPAVLRDLALVREDEVDLLDVLRAEPVLVLALPVLAVRVDEQHLAAQRVGLALVAYQHAGGDAGAVEQAGRQADDRLDHVVLDQQLADEPLLAPAEQHAVGHDGGHVAVGLQARQHVLDEHEVGLLAGLRAPFAEAVGEAHVGAAVVLRERGVGEHPVELADLPVLQDLRVLQRIPVPDGEVGDVVEDHVHVADRPRGAVRVLPVERQIVRVLALLLHVAVRLDQEAAGTGGGVVDRVAGPGPGELHQQAHHFRGRVELAALLARAVREVLDQVLVGRPQQVRELEVVVDEDEARLVEMVEQVLPPLIRDPGLPPDGVEIDVVLEHAVELVVLVLHRRDGLVEHVADVVLQILERRNPLAVPVRPRLVPAGARRHVEGVAVGGLVLQHFGQQRGPVREMGVVPFAQLRALAVELVGEAFEEQHPEDELLELGGVHLAAQDVRGPEEEGFELGEGDLLAGHRPDCLNAGTASVCAAKADSTFPRATTVDCLTLKPPPAPPRPRCRSRPLSAPPRSPRPNSPGPRA